VNANPIEGCCFGGAPTDSDGTYTIDGLAPGTYRVVAAAPGFVFEIYDDTIDISLATPVTVTSGATAPDIDFALSTGGGISGQVRDEAGNPLQGVFVEASLIEGCCSNGGATTGPDGAYTIDGIAPGSYRVLAFISPTSPAGVFYNNTTDLASATPVAVADGAITPSIDFTLPTGGSISGRVTDESGNPIEGAPVDAMLFEGCCAFSVATTDSDGTYTIAGLPAGSYRLFASATGFASEYYDDTADASLASPIPVADGADTPGIDFALSACNSPWPIAAGDEDCDGYPTAVEKFIGTNPLMPCDDGLEPSDWPPDINGDTTADLIDVILFKPHFFTSDPDPGYEARFDLDMSGTIDLIDILVFKPYYSASCTP
jgi:protocatechuate 3,4-dioxygenase beta subunit